jgi:hypothetical protein
MFSKLSLFPLHLNVSKALSPETLRVPVKEQFLKSNSVIRLLVALPDHLIMLVHSGGTREPSSKAFGLLSPLFSIIALITAMSPILKTGSAARAVKAINTKASAAVSRLHEDWVIIFFIVTDIKLLVNFMETKRRQRPPKRSRLCE